MRYAMLLLLLLTTPNAFAGATPPSIGALHWLAGCWSYEGAEPGSLEQWTAPAGGTMLGVSRTVRDGTTKQWEFVRIVEGDDGTLAYIALPSGQKEAAFPAIEAGPSRVVFENKAHDFPQRVGYELVSPGKISAWIEGTVDAKPRRSTWDLRKFSCP